MPRSGGGVYSLPPGTSDFTPGTVIESGKVDLLTADIQTTFNTAQPIVYGGGGAATAIANFDNWNTLGADIASATTTNLAAATGTAINITGTATITGLGTLQAGAVRTLTFTGAATLTHNATSLILPGAANIVTAAGDTAKVISLGSGNWRMLWYQRAAAAPLGNPVPVTQGGTGSITAAAARTALFGVSTTTTRAIAIYNGTTGALQNSLAVVDASGNILIPNTTGLSNPAGTALVSIGVGASNNAVSISSGADGIGLGTNGTLSMVAGSQISLSASTGGITVDSGATVPAVNLVRGQLQFPSTANPSANATTLDDYRENTWTPGVAFGGASTGVTYASRPASYVKIGSMVLFNAQITLTSKGSSTGSATITGLPHAAVNPGSVSIYYFAALGSNVSYMSGAAGSGTSITLYYSATPSTSLSLMDNTLFSNTTVMYISGSYQAS